MFSSLPSTILVRWRIKTTTRHSASLENDGSALSLSLAVFTSSGVFVDDGQFLMELDGRASIPKRGQLQLSVTG